MTPEIEDFDLPTNSVSSHWTKGLKGEELKTHIEWLYNGLNYWDELRLVLKELYRERHQMTSDFSTPDWAYRNAYALGYERALQDVHKLLPRPRSK